MSLTDKLVAVQEILHTCKEDRRIAWKQEYGLGIDSVNAAWVEDVFQGKTWREVRIPDRENLVDWLLYLPESMLPRAIPAILDFCCGDPEHHEVPLDILKFRSRYFEPVTDWDDDVVKAVELYLYAVARKKEIDRIMKWINRARDDSR